MTPKAGENDWLMPDAARGAAALVVAVAHAYQVFIYPLHGATTWLSVVGSGATWSVAVFFLLSGILIATSIRRRTRDGGFVLADYMWARALRIWPPLVASVAVTLLVLGIVQSFDLYGAKAYLLPGDLASARESATFSWSTVVTTLALTYQLWPGHEFLQFNGPLWSLSFEWWLYVLAGLLSSAVLNRSRVALAGACVLAFLMFVHSTASTPPFWAVACIWGAGFVAGWNWQSVKLLPKRGLFGCALALCVVGAFVAGAELVPSIVAPYSGVRQHLVYVLFSWAVLGGLIVVLRSSPPKWLRLLSKLGRFSYTLYLIHFPLFLLSLSLFRPFIIRWGEEGHCVLALASLCVVLIISNLLARVVENRALLMRIFLREPTRAFDNLTDKSSSLGKSGTTQSN